MLALAAYELIAPAAFPAEGIVIALTPNSLAFDTAADNPLALNEAVGFNPSSLMSKSCIPISFPKSVHFKIGV